MPTIVASKSIRSWKRTPWGTSVRGWPEFKKNMRTMSRVANSRVLSNQFYTIAVDVKSDMDHRIHSIVAPETEKYRRWKASRMRARKTGSTYETSLRKRGVVAKRFSASGKNLSFTAVHYKYAPHAYWIEKGTGERVTKTGARRGRVPGEKSGFKPGFFRPVVNEWRRSGRFFNRAERAVKMGLVEQAKKLTITGIGARIMLRAVGRTSLSSSVVNVVRGKR